MSSFFEGIGNLIGGALDLAGDIIGGAVDLIGNIFSGIGNAIAGLFGGLTPDVPTPNTAASPDGVLLTKTGSNMDIPVIYGFRRVGGRIVFAETNGDNNTYLNVVYVICEGEISRIKRIYVDDVQIPGSDYAFGTTHSATSGRFANRMQWQVFAGTETQSQSSLANQAPSWNNRTRKLPGVAYAVFRYEWKKIESQEDADNNPYRGGIPAIKFDVEGKKVYDVTTHSSGANLSNDYGALTKTFSYNPVSCTLDYLMNPRYGCGIDKTEINADAFKTAAIKCNQQVTYATGQQGKAITMNAVVSTQPKLLENVKMLLSGCRAFLPYIQGRYKIKIEDGGNAQDITSASLTSAFDVTTDHLVSTVALQGEKKENKYNQVIVRYVDPDKEFTEQQVSYSESADVSSDGEDLIGDFQFFTIANKNIAEDIARMIYKKSRDQRYIQFSATPELLAVEPGDIITVTSDVLNLSSQTFRVTNMNFDTNGAISVQARQHNATLYPFVSGTEIVTPAKTFAPDTYNLTPISPLTPSTPISVAPPNDPEGVITGFDSAGEPIEESASTDNDEAVQSPDEQSQGNVVTKFSSIGGDTGTALLVSAQGYIFPVNAIIGSARSLQFEFNPPQDQTIDQIKIYEYSISSGALLSVQSFPIRYDEAYPTTCILRSLSDDSYLIPRFVNTTNNTEYQDGSTGTYSAIAYTNINLQSASGKGLEAVINNALQAVDFESDPNRRITVHQLA